MLNSAKQVMNAVILLKAPAERTDHQPGDQRTKLVTALAVPVVKPMAVERRWGATAPARDSSVHLHRREQDGGFQGSIKRDRYRWNDWRCRFSDR
jgi:hypothetical protein